MKPSIGRIVHYRLSEADRQRITEKGNRPLPDGRSPLYNSPSVGQTVAAVIVATWADDTANLQLLLDGELALWITSAHLGDGPGTWSWPPRV